jgi:Ca2+-binding RTX toxin-like protein
MAETASGAIGTLSDTDGPVTVIRADGSEIEAQPGTEIFPGDTVITGDGGAAFVTLADGSELRLDEFGEMVVDGVDAVTVLQGAFVVIAGMVDGEPSVIVVQTPSAVVTVDGATLVGLARPEGEESAFTLLPNPDGSLGLVEVATDAGSQLLLQPYQTTTTVALAEAPGPIIVVADADFTTLYADALGVLGDLAVETAGGDASSKEDPSGPVTEPVVFDIEALDAEREDLFSTLFENTGGRLSAAPGIEPPRLEDPISQEPGGPSDPENPGARSFLSEDESASEALAPGFITDKVFFSDLAAPFDTLLGDPGANIGVSSGNDIFNGDAGGNFVALGDGNDIAFGHEAGDQIWGDGGNDFLFGDSVTIDDNGRSLVDPAGAGNDTLYGGEGFDYLEGNHGDDFLFGGNGGDSYAWGSGWGRDTILDSAGDDRLGLFQDLGRGFLPDALHSFDTFTLDTLSGGGTTATTVISYGGLGMMYLPVDFEAYHSGVDLMIDDATTAADDGVRIVAHSQGLPLESVYFDDFTLSMTVTAAGTADDDFLVGSAGKDVLLAGDGRDAIYGGIGNDFLSGGAERDFLIGGDGADSLLGGTGDDYLTGGAGADTIDGGDGLDWLSLTAATTRTYTDLMTGRSWESGGATDTITGIENVRGSAYGDYISGDDGTNEILGGDGRDSVIGRGGTDFLWGMGGTDVMNGGDGDDVLIGDYGNLQAPPGSEPGSFDLLLGGAGNDYLFGNIGNDSLYGGEGDDRLFGEQGNDHLEGNAGNDFLRDDRGSNTLDGGEGDDILFGRGENTLIGGDGIDTVYYADAEEIVAGHSADRVYVDLDVGVSGIDGTNQLLSGIENVVGTQQNDYIVGDGQDNILRGLNGDDSLSSQAGNDVLMGGGGNDFMDGGSGADTLNGGSGNDTLRGGADSDFYVFGATANRAGASDGGVVMLSATFSSLREAPPFDSEKAPDGIALDDIDRIVDSGGQFDALGFGQYAWVDSISQLNPVTPERITAYRQGDDLIIRDLDASGEMLDEFDQPITVTVNAGVDIINQYAGNTVEFFLFETLPGTVFGFEAAGTAESDFLVGGESFDVIDGGADDDLLFGNGGGDTLIGGGGDDMLRGGGGGDRFAFESALDGHDVIVDFNPAEGDIVDLDTLFDSLGTDVGARDGAISFADTADGLSMTVAGAPDFSVTFSGWDVGTMTPDFLASIVTDVNFGD